MPLATVIACSSAASPAAARPFLSMGASAYNGDVSTCISKNEAMTIWAVAGLDNELTVENDKRLKSGSW